MGTQGDGAGLVVRGTGYEGVQVGYSGGGVQGRCSGEGAEWVLTGMVQSW